MTLEADILQGLTPGDDERRLVDAARTSLEQDGTKTLHELGIDGEAQVQGSIAKDTWISGDTDMDCFLVLPMDTPEEALEDLVTKVANATLQGAHKKYAQHPYLIGERDGFQVDLVPAYRITSPEQRLSAVDRTPLHTSWVHEHLDDDTKQQVRLTKQWCKGIGVYGAETRIGGLSGYLLEVLVQRFSGFQGFLRWAAADCTPRRIALGDDDVDDDVSPLVVVDPVDATRNCAAAVTGHAIGRLHEAAVAYQESPDRRFFHPEPARKEPAHVLHDHLADDDATWLGIVLAPQTERLDLVFPQFQRAARVVADALDREGFPVRRHQVDAWDHDRAVGIQWITDAVELPPRRTHQGPAADREPNASRFHDKWSDHPDADGGITTDDKGRLQVTLHVRDRTAGQWLQTHLKTALVGKHVLRALDDDATVLTDPAHVPDAWAAAVADHVLDRRPWQREPIG